MFGSKEAEKGDAGVDEYGEVETKAGADAEVPLPWLASVELDECESWCSGVYDVDGECGVVSEAMGDADAIPLCEGAECAVIWRPNTERSVGASKRGATAGVREVDARTPK